MFAFAGAATAAPIANAQAFQNALQDDAALPNVETVRWRGGGRGWGGRGWGYGGFAAGALIGGALVARPYYGPSPYYYGYAPYYAPPPPPPAYMVEDGGDVSYCMQRFKSYDPRSGTYLGYDGNRHPCP
jgi:hypothetical protein